MRIYLDHNATTPAAEAVVEAVVAAMRDLVGNGSSVHSFGQQAKGAIDRARTSVAALIGGEPAEVVFTSGGTESSNLAIRGAAEALEPTGRRGIVVSGIEHEAVLQTSRALARRGWNLTVVPVEGNGIVSP
jgi:cysteine desulfurase